MSQSHRYTVDLQAAAVLSQFVTRAVIALCEFIGLQIMGTVIGGAEFSLS